MANEIDLEKVHNLLIDSDLGSSESKILLNYLREVDDDEEKPDKIRGVPITRIIEDESIDEGIDYPAVAGGISNGGALGYLAKEAYSSSEFLQENISEIFANTIAGAAGITAAVSAYKILDRSRSKKNKIRPEEDGSIDSENELYRQVLKELDQRYDNDPLDRRSDNKVSEFLESYIRNSSDHR